MGNNEGTDMGHSRARAMSHQHSHGAAGALLVYGTAKHLTCENVEPWLKEHVDDSNSIIMLWAIGVICVTSGQVLEMKQELWQKRNVFSFIETSALDSADAEIAFPTILTKIHHTVSQKQRSEGCENDMSSSNRVVPIYVLPTTGNKPKVRCCQNI